MNSIKTFIAMALIASLAMQPIAAQPVEQTTEQQSKIVKQLKDSYKNLTQHLKCAVKRNCTPEQKKRIRRTIYALVGTLIALYVGKKFWKGRDTGLKVRPDPSFRVAKRPKTKSSLATEKSLDQKFLERLAQLPSSTNPDVADNIAKAKLFAQGESYTAANQYLEIAESIIKKESKK